MEYSVSVQKALERFDTQDFNPYEGLRWKEISADDNLFKDFECDLPITPGDFVGKREMLLNLLSFNGSAIIAARYDSGFPHYKFIEGLPYTEDVPDYKALNEVGWHFFMIDTNMYKSWYENARYVFNYNYGQMPFTVKLEKEFAFEIAILLNDGKLHRIYHMYY